MNRSPDGRSAVIQVPPGFCGVQIATPQLPVEALSGQRVLLDLKRVVFDIVKRWRYNPGSVFFDSLEDWLSPANIKTIESLTRPVKMSIFLFVLNINLNREIPLKTETQ